jgi:hypothetical protein
MKALKDHGGDDESFNISDSVGGLAPVPAIRVGADAVGSKAALVGREFVIMVSVSQSSRTDAGSGGGSMGDGIR